MSELVEKITAAYEMDQLRTPERVGNTFELPRSYESIAPEWLTAILCAKRHGTTVVGYRLDAPDNGSWNRRKIHLEYSEPGNANGLPQALFCKAAHDLSNRIILGFSGCASSEATFYNHIRPLLDIEAPESLFAWFDPESFNCIIVLPDLSDRVAEFCSYTTQITRERAEGQLALLAEVHGRCYHNPQLTPQLMSLPTWPELFEKMIELGIQEGSSNGFRAAERVIPQRIYRQFTAIWPAVMASVQRHNWLPQTLIHGDVHMKNWYMTRSGKMGLVDWETACRGHWSRDVAHVMSTALTVEDRRAWERDLLRFYIDRIRAAGGPVVSFDEAWAHYRQQLMSALAWWTLTLTGEPDFPEVQAESPVMEFVHRAAVAVDDMESLESF